MIVHARRPQDLVTVAAIGPELRRLQPLGTARAALVCRGLASLHQMYCLRHLLALLPDLMAHQYLFEKPTGAWRAGKAGREPPTAGIVARGDRWVVEGAARSIVQSAFILLFTFPHPWH